MARFTPFLKLVPAVAPEPVNSTIDASLTESAACAGVDKLQARVMEIRLVIANLMLFEEKKM